MMMTMLMVIGSALPFLIAWALIASTNDENPLDRIPDYDKPLQETVNVSPDRITPARTLYEYRWDVRLIFEGTLALPDGAQADAFYIYTDADGHALDTPQPHAWALTFNEAAPDALPEYDREHAYTLVYPVGRDWTRITFAFSGPKLAAGGELRVTVIQIE